MEGNVEVDVAEETQQQIDTIVLGLVDIISICGFVFGLLLIFSFGSSKPYYIFFALFYSTVASVHVISLIRSAFPKYEIEADLPKRILLSSDSHYVAVVFIFVFAEISPILFVSLYLFLYSSSILKVVIKILGHNNPSTIKLKQMMVNPIYKQIPSYLEIALTFQLFFLALFSMKALTWMAFFVYVIWFLAFNYANDELHVRAWSNIGLFLREIASRNAETFGTQLESFVDKVAEFGNSLSKLYPSKELKVHLQ